MKLRKIYMLSYILGKWKEISKLDGSELSEEKETIIKHCTAELIQMLIKLS